MNVETGDIVSKGQKVGTVGETGMAFGVHLHYEINTTTRRGKPLYPYLDCEEQDPYTHNHTDICRDLLEEHSDDPIVFHEKYDAIIVASTIDPKVDAHGSAPEDDDNEDSALEQDHGHDHTDDVDTNTDIDVDAVTIDNAVDDTSLDLDAIYDIINKYIPDLNANELSSQTKQFLDDYGIEITHTLTPTVKEGEEIKIEFHVYNKRSKAGYKGTLPVEINLIPVNTNIRARPSSITSLDDSGRAIVRISGSQRGASILVFTIEDKIFYALPVVVK
jgi:hypothetical protein